LGSQRRPIYNIISVNLLPVESFDDSWYWVSIAFKQGAQGIQGTAQCIVITARWGVVESIESKPTATDIEVAKAMCPDPQNSAQLYCESSGKPEPSK
jgi:hypothetical protein